MGRMKFKTLKKALIDEDITYSELADRIGITRQTMSHKIHGQRKWLLLECIAIKKELKSDLPLEELFAE